MEGKTMSVEAKASSNSSSWVVEMEKLLPCADPEVEKKRWESHYIYRVPEWLKKATDRSAYMPGLVSLGPFYHGHRDLLPMEEHKRRAMLHLVKRSEKPLQEFVDTVAEVAEQLMDAYKDISAEKSWSGENNQQRFVEMMVMDGCFLVEVMRMSELCGKLDDYDSKDPIFSEHGYLYILPRIKHDVIVIENQLPLLLISRILYLHDPETYKKPEDVNRSVLHLLECTNELDDMDTVGLHPLGILHSSFTCKPSGWMDDSTSSNDKPGDPGCDREDDNTSSAEKMREAGIHFQKSATDSVLDIHYDERGGVLSMPCLEVDGLAPMMLLNMMAFERLHTDPEARNDVTAYVYFMDDIIDTAWDVELLKSKGILKSEMGSDKDVANLFNNTLGRGTVMGSSSKLRRVRRLVYKHCEKKRNRWRASLMDTYFSNPWVFISLVAAAILLVATLVQTVCTVVKCQH